MIYHKYAVALCEGIRVAAKELLDESSHFDPSLVGLFAAVLPLTYCQVCQALQTFRFQSEQELFRQLDCFLCMQPVQVEQALGALIDGQVRCDGGCLATLQRTGSNDTKADTEAIADNLAAESTCTSLSALA